MKNTFRILITLLLALSLIFSATSCDVLEELGIDAESILGSGANEQGGETEKIPRKSREIIPVKTIPE